MKAQLIATNIDTLYAYSLSLILVLICGSA